MIYLRRNSTSRMSSFCTFLWMFTLTVFECRLKMCLTRVVSFSVSILSRTMKIKSNLLRIVDWKSSCSSMLSRSFYLPRTGFAAARMLTRVLSMAVMPALAMLMVCCSIASWIATLSWLRILSNSSIQTTPPSPNTIAPPSS